MHLAQFGEGGSSAGTSRACRFGDAQTVELKNTAIRVEKLDGRLVDGR